MQNKSRSPLHFAHLTRAISAEGCPRAGQIALSPAFRALDTHDLHRGLPARRTNRALACISHSARMISAEGCPRPGQIALSPAFRVLALGRFHSYTGILTLAFLHWDTYTCILALGRFHPYTGILTLAYFHLQTCKCSRAIVSIEVEVFKRKYRSVSVQAIFRKNPSQCFREKCNQI